VIAQLRGAVSAVTDEWVVLDVGGVGYRVFVHPRTGAWLRGQSAAVLLHIHTAVRDDAISLYGFPTAEELACFRLLIGVERIGPKAALAILARAEWPVLVQAIQAGEAVILAAVPGIGPKTAARVILELRGKLDGLDARVPAAAGAAPPVARALTDSAVGVLTGLGFSTAQARGAVAAAVAAAEPAGLEELVAAALRRLDPVGPR